MVLKLFWSFPTSSQCIIINQKLITLNNTQFKLSCLRFPPVGPAPYFEKHCSRQNKERERLIHLCVCCCFESNSSLLLNQPEIRSDQRDWTVHWSLYLLYCSSLHRWLRPLSLYCTQRVPVWLQSDMFFTYQQYSRVHTSVITVFNVTFHFTFWLMDDESNMFPH